MLRACRLMAFPFRTRALLLLALLTSFSVLLAVAPVSADEEESDDPFQEFLVGEDGENEGDEVVISAEEVEEGGFTLDQSTFNSDDSFYGTTEFRGTRETVNYDGINFILTKSRDEVVIPEGIPEFHTVVRGDTLWDISGTYLLDNFLWPIIWEINIGHIPNPHLIYPGQKVFLPRPGPLMRIPPAGLGFEDDLANDGTDDDRMSDEDLVALFGTDMTTPTGEDPSDILIRPVLTAKEMERVGYIVSDKEKAPFKIIKSEYLDVFKLSKSDICYINRGSVDDTKVGDKFFVWNYIRKVHHPVTGKFLGWFANNFGVIRVICVFEQASIAVIEDSYEPISVGDYISPYAEVPSPWSRETGLGVCSVPAELNPGHIVETRENFLAQTSGVFSARNDVVYIDLGYEDNVGPGDYFMIYDENNRRSSIIPQNAIGELIVLRSSEETSAALITKGKREILLGNAVDFIQFTRTDIEGITPNEDEMRRRLREQTGIQ